MGTIYAMNACHHVRTFGTSRKSHTLRFLDVDSTYRELTED